MGMLALIPGLVVTLLASTVSDDAIRREVADVYRDRDYQEMPAEGAAPAEMEPEPPGPRRPGRSGGSSPPDLPGSGASLGPLLAILAWTCVIAAGALVLWWMAREWAPFWPGGPMSRRRRAARGTADATVARVPVAEEAPPEFEVHAGAGRFPEAVHALLLLALWEIGRRRRRPFDPALTSREILPRAGLEADAREALDGIVATVEAGLFGGREIGRNDFKKCEMRYGRVMRALAGGAA